MGEESGERSGRIAGIVKSIFGRKKGELPMAPPPSPPQEIKQPPDIAELNLIKEKVQSVSRPAEAAGDWKQPIPPQMPSAAKTPQMDIAFKGHDAVSAPQAQALAKPRQQDAVPGEPATISAAQAQAVAKTAQQDSTPQVSAGPPASGKSSLDEIKRRIEESAQRKNPAHLKKNIEQVNEHLNYVKRKSALSEKKIEHIVDEKVREELERMGSSIKERLKRGPAQAEREQLEKFQKQLVGLMDVSDRKSELELEQMRSQMEEMRQQMKDLPLIVARKELEELSPIREEVAVLRGELRKSIPTISDPGERSKLEDTLARAEALSKRLEYNPQVESVRAELGEIKSSMGTFASAIEKVGQSGEEIKKQELEERESIKQGMDSLKKEIRSVPEALKESESPKLDSIRRSISELRTLVQQNAEAKQPPAERRMLNEILAHLSAIEQKQTEDERKLSRLLNLDADSMKLMDSLRRRMDGVSRRVSSEGQAEMDAFREELRSLQRSVRASISSSRSEEEQELLTKLHGELSRLITASEGRSAAALGELKGELAEVSKRISRIPASVGAREKFELDSIRGDIVGMQKLIGDALAKPRNEEERILLRSLQSRLEGLLEAGESRIEHELAEVRSSVSRIPSVVGARERPELDAIKGEIVGMQSVVSEELSKPRNEEEKRLLKGLQSRLEDLMRVSKARSSAEFGRLEKELADVRGSVSRIPGIVGARERPELDAIRGEILGLQNFVGAALSQPKNEEERRLLKSLQSRLEELSRVSEAKSSAEFGRLEGELSDVRRKLSRIPASIEAGEEKLSAFLGRDEENIRRLQDLDGKLMSALSKIGARTDDEIETVRSQIEEVHRQIGGLSHRIGTALPADFESLRDELHSMRESIRASLSTSRSREEAELLVSLQKELNNIIEKLEERSDEQFGKLEHDIADVRKRVSGIPAKLDESRPEIEALDSELHSLRSAVDRALAQPKNEEEKSLLKGIKSQLSSMISLSEAKSSSEFGALRGDLDEVKRRLSRIPSVLGARERPELDAIRGEILGLQKFVGAALAQPKNEEEKRLLRSLQSRLEDLSQVSEARSAAEFGRLEGELADVRSAVSKIPSAVGAREKYELDAIRGEVLSMQKVVSDALSQPKNEEEKRLLKSLQVRLEELSQVSEARSVSEFGRLEKELADVRSSVSRIPSAVGAREKFELDSVRNEILGLQKAVADALSRPKDEEEKRLLRGLQARLEGLLQVSDTRNIAEFGRLEGELADVRSAVSKIPSAVGAREKFEMDAVHGEISGLQRAVADALSQPKNEEEKRLLKGLQGRLEELSRSSDAKSSAEFGRLEGELADIRSNVSRIPSVVGAREKSELDAIHTEVLGMQKLVADALAQPKNEDEKRLLKSLQSRLEDLMGVSEARSAAEFGRLEGELADVRSRVSRIPGIVGASEKPELDSIRSEILGLQGVVGDALARPKGEEEKKLLRSLQSRLEELSQVSEARSVSEFGRLEKELSDVRNVVSKIPSAVGAREKFELDSMRSEVSALQKIVADALAQPKNEEEKRLLKSLQGRLEDLSRSSDAKSSAEFGLIEKELADVRGSVSRIPGIVGAREKFEMDTVHSEISGLQRAVADALAQPKNEEEKRLLKSLQGRLEELSQVSEARSVSEFGRLEKELADVRTSVSRIPSAVGARERYELDSVKGEIASLKRAVSDALSRPLDEYEKNLLKGMQSRLEGLVKVSESHSVVEFGRLEGELADIRTRLSRLPSLVGSREKADVEYIQGEISGLKRVVAEALSKPKDEVEKRFLKGLQSRLESLLELSDANAQQQIGGLKKELDDVRKKMSVLPYRVEAGEKPELDGIKGEVERLRSIVEGEIRKPKGVEERKLLNRVLSQLDGMLKFFDARAGAGIDAVKFELDSVAGKVSELYAEKGGAASVAKEVHELGDSLGKGIATTGRKDRELLGKISERLEALSTSVGTETSAAAAGLRKELEDMRNQVVAMISAEQPQVESLQFTLLSLRDMVEKALEKPGSEELESMLNSLNSRLAGMLSEAEDKTDADYNRLRGDVEAIQKELRGIPAGIAAEKPEIESIRSAVKSLQEAIGVESRPSVDADQDYLAPIFSPKQPQSETLSEIKDSISSLKDILEKRSKGKAKKAAKRPSKRPQKKSQAGRPKKAAKGRLKHPLKKPQKGKSKSSAKGREEGTARLRAVRPQTLRKKAGTTAGNKTAFKQASVHVNAVPGARRKSGFKPARTPVVHALKKPRHTISRHLEMLLNEKRANSPLKKNRPARSSSEVDSFIADIEKRRKSVPEIVRRLGGEYSTQPRRSSLSRSGDDESGPERRESAGGREVGERRALERDEDLPEARPHEKLVRDVPERRLHEDYGSYLKDDKMGKIGSDVKRMHARLKDIRKLYEEEF